MSDVGIERMVEIPRAKALDTVYLLTDHTYPGSDQRRFDRKLDRM